MRSTLLAFLIAMCLAACPRPPVNRPETVGGATSSEARLGQLVTGEAPGQTAIQNPSSAHGPTPGQFDAKSSQKPGQEILIDAATHELGWKKLSRTAKGSRVMLPFASSANTTEWVLGVAHSHVTETWKVLLNDQPVGYLDPHRGESTSYLPIPPGLLINGQNVVAIVSDGGVKPILVRGVRLRPNETLRSVTPLGTVRVTVADGAGAAIPARVTITDEDNHWVQPYYPSGRHVAARMGVAYAMTEPIAFQLPVGRYRLYATHGMEWSMDRASVTVERDREVKVRMTVRRVVDTAGYISADTHLHTRTFSGHGNATVQERLVTLAGEGVQFAVATDHNHNTDYRPDMARLGLDGYFHAVTGNEVTTPIGHFNGFPLDPDDPVPDYYVRDYVKLVAGIRAKGARIVILNHPRWPSVDNSPFAWADLNQVTGETASDMKLTVDAVELVNTNTLIDHPMVLFADWFALLNRGDAITAVGTSDSHTVEAPPGQARTYVAVKRSRSGAIDEDEIYDALAAGRTSISMGIFTELRLAGGQGPGDLVAVERRRLSLGLRVAAPEWIRPRTAFVYLNGQEVARREIAGQEGQPVDVDLSFTITTPKHDGHLVCVVVGAPPVAPVWHPVKGYALAATNPIYLDVDGDGKYRSPRATAERELARLGTDLRRIERALKKLDPVIGAQVLSLLRGRVDTMIEGQISRHKLAVPRPHTQLHDASEAHSHP